ncbi:hypothetical protein PMIN03_005536 [Paraphaeosphaeria minitans]
MARLSPSKNDHINIVGAVIFGLSTALHLARRGYKNVTFLINNPTMRHSIIISRVAMVPRPISTKYTFRVRITNRISTTIDRSDRLLEAMEHRSEKWHRYARGHVTSGQSVHSIRSLSLTNGEELPDLKKATVANIKESGQSYSSYTQVIRTNKEHHAIAASRGIS